MASWSDDYGHAWTSYGGVTLGAAYAESDGIAGSYIGTGDEPDMEITGDLEIEFDMALASWGWVAIRAFGAVATSASVDHPWQFGATWNTAPGQFFFKVQLAGGMEEVLSSAAPGLGANARGLIKITREVSSGDVKFYVDGGQLGTTQSTTAGAIVYEEANARIAATGDGTAQPSAGKFYSMAIKDGLGGPVVAKFDAAGAYNEVFGDSMLTLGVG